METLTLIFAILSFLLTLTLIGSFFFAFRYFIRNKETIAEIIKKEFLPSIKIIDPQGNINQVFSEMEGEPKEILAKLIEGKLASTQEEIETLSQLFKSDPDVHKHFPGMTPTSYSGIGLKPESIAAFSEHQEELKGQAGPYVRKLKSKKGQAPEAEAEKSWVYRPPGTPFNPK